MFNDFYFLQAILNSINFLYSDLKVTFQYSNIDFNELISGLTIRK